MRALAIGLLIVAGLWTWGFFSEFCLKGSLAELPKADKIVVHKAERTLTLYRASEVLKSYKVALGFNPIGHKEFEGDGKTPEGNYTIDSKNPKSRYFLNLGINYPNAIDTQNAQNAGKSAGGDIKIHGLPNGWSAFERIFGVFDWTSGCIAVDNISMKEIYEAVAVGTPIEILP